MGEPRDGARQVGARRRASRTAAVTMQEKKKLQMPPVQAEPSLTRQVYDTIRNSILSGQLPRGSLFSVQALADQLHVSRTPVREALIDLSTNGLVSFERNRGVRILETSVQDLQDIFSLRLLLEVPATYRAAQQFMDDHHAQLQQAFEAQQDALEAGDQERFMEADRRFHAVILEAADNRRLAETVGKLRDLVQSRGISTVGRSRPLSGILEEHSAILTAIRSGDPRVAARAMRDHIAHTGELVVAQHDSGSVSMASSWLELLELG